MKLDDLDARIRNTMIDIVRLPAPPGQEDAVCAYLQRRLAELDVTSALDHAGNLLASIPATNGTVDAQPLLLGAHMDRVEPGRGCEPVIHGDQMFSDGYATLGADDAAGLTIILVTLQDLGARHIPHGPLFLLFSARNELGLRGVREFDARPSRVREGIVFENADMPGVLVLRGPEIITIDAQLRGVTGHTGQDLSGTASAVEMFRRLELPTGILDGGATRISLERVVGGTARNAVAEVLTVEGELRTLLGPLEQAEWERRIESYFHAAAGSLNGTAEVRFVHSPAYIVNENEPLVQAFKEAWEDVGGTFQTVSTFVGGDANVLRTMKDLKVFTVSIGVVGEHTFAETIALPPLRRLAEATIKLLARYRSTGYTRR